MSALIFTIGHSTHSSAKLVELLKAHEITAVVDVRSQPYSRWNPQFNREMLQSALKARGMAYVFLGRELGARSQDRSCYLEGKVQYDRLAKTAPFQEGLDRVEQGSSRYRVALLCAEKDPLTCHRTILVCRHLVDRGLRIAHILEDGSVELHNDALTRLLKEVGVDNGELFRSYHELIDEAYDKRGKEIAYEEKPNVLSSSDAEPYAL